MTEQNATLDAQPKPQIVLLRMDALCEKLSASPSTIDRMMQNEGLPLPVRLSSRSKAWVEHEIDEWIVNRARSARPCPEADYRS